MKREEQVKHPNRYSVKVNCESLYPRKSRLVYILLAIFLGGLGVHNFYAGRSGCAIFQCLISLFIGWLIIPLIIVYVWVLFEILAVNRDGSGIAFY
jgi:TM2 domain-containing membrane protein YozV